jgi:nucleoside-triphosphatase THEP1
MVYIISGGINTGKTTAIEHLYHDFNGLTSINGQSDYTRLNMHSDGFISVKKMNGLEVVGYKVKQLSNGHSMDLILRDKYITKDFEVACKIGPYCFSAPALKWVEICVKDMIGFKMEAIFIDEIGMLELDGKGFDKVIIKILESGADLYITVRGDLIAAILHHYNIKKYKKVSNWR